MTDYNRSRSSTDTPFVLPPSGSSSAGRELAELATVARRYWATLQDPGGNELCIGAD